MNAKKISLLIRELKKEVSTHVNINTIPGVAPWAEGYEKEPTVTGVQLGYRDFVENFEGYKVITIDKYPKLRYYTKSYMGVIFWTTFNKEG